MLSPYLGFHLSMNAETGVALVLEITEFSSFGCGFLMNGQASFAFSHLEQLFSFIVYAHTLIIIQFCHFNPCIMKISQRSLSRTLY